MRASRSCLLRRAGAAALCLAVLGGLLVIFNPPAEHASAALATGGAGQYREQIEWFEWGAAGDPIPDEGITKTNTVEVGGETLEITCSIANISRSRGTQTGRPLLAAYRPGDWENDGLDKLYNVGGTGRNNQLISGITNYFDGNTLSFDFSCATSVGGQAVPVPGLVIADAESSSNPEYVEATPSGPATWRIIDRFRAGGCDASTIAQRNAGNTLRLRGGARECAGGGPTAVAFMEGASSARATIYGRGKSAIALGVMIGVDRADAPASFGDAPHVATPTFDGGTIPADQDTPVHGAFALATQAPPPLTLGSGVSDEPQAKFSADARGDNLDDAFGDESAGGGLGQLDLVRGRAYTLPAGTCRDARPPDQRTGGAIRGWIDFDGDGTFDADEASETAACTPDGTFQLTWPEVPADTVPADLSFVRIRFGADPAGVASPRDFSAAGEVEDYGVRLNLATLNLVKELPGRADPADQFAVSIGRDDDPDAIATAETAGEADRAETGAQIVDDGAYTLSEAKTAGPTGLADYAAAIDCIDVANDNAAVEVAGTAPRWRIDGLTPRQRVSCTITNRPQPAGITLDKSAGEPTGAAAGDTIPYTFTVTNTGEGPLETVAVSDAKFVDEAGDSTVRCPSATLAPGAAMDCTAEYTLTQADVDAGTVDNTATVTATTLGGRGVSATDEVSTTIPSAAALEIEKTATVSPAERQNAAQAGDRIAYTFVVGNTGNVTLADVAVDDAAAGTITCNATTLAPGQETTCAAAQQREVTQADVDAGAPLTNTAAAVGTAPRGDGVRSEPDAAEVPVAAAAPALELVKFAERPGLEPGAPLAEGQQIAYTFAVTNTGNVTIAGVAVDDPLAGLVSCEVTTLAPGERAACAADEPYVVTAEDAERGTVTNTAQASGQDPGGGAVASNEDSVTVPSGADAQLSLIKTAAQPEDRNDNGIVDAGDTIAYTFEVQNTGNVALTNVAVDDPLIGPVTCDVAALEPAAVAQCAADEPYEITAADVENGAVENTATASGQTGGGAVVTASDSTRTPTDQVARIALEKTAGEPADANDNGRVDAGDTIDYGFTVTNTGSVTVANVEVQDALVGDVVCPAGPLAPGESVTCEAAAYALTQADIDAGSVHNTATATATGTGGEPVETADAATTTAIEQAAELLIAKTAGEPADENASGRVDAGDTIAYAFEVTNTGNVSIGGVGVADAQVANIVCEPLNLAPGETATCTGDAYVLTQDDVDRGSVTNTATASGTDPAGAPVESAAGTATTSFDAVAALQLEKTAEPPVDANENGRIDAGDEIGYAFSVVNTGAVTLRDVAVEDDNLAAVTCEPGTLAPGEAATCRGAAYVIVQADVDAGGVVNSAAAVGTPPDGPEVRSAAASAETPIEGVPSLVLSKSADEPVDVNGNGRVDAGDEIAYRFRVENTGSLTLSGVGVDDPTAGAVVCEATELAPGGATDCAASARYVITPADVDAGAVVNTATAVGTPPGGEPVTSAPDTVTTLVPGIAAVELVKRADDPRDTNRNGRIDAGDEVWFTFTVTNVGAVTLGDVGVDDPLAGSVTCATKELNPQIATDCMADRPYVLTQDDVDAGVMRNIATARGTPPGGEVLLSNSASTETLVEPADALVFQKRAGGPRDSNNSGAIDAGDEIDYTFSMRNVGNVTISELSVVDAAVQGVECAADSVAPGDTVDCTARAYRITDADVARGGVRNIAYGTGRTPGGAVVQSAPAEVVSPVGGTPRLELAKSAGDPIDANGSGRVDAGDEISYSFTVRNSGTALLDEVAVADPALGAVACVATSLAPGEQTSCAAAGVYRITQADADAGTVGNVATASARAPDGVRIESSPAGVDVPVPPVAELALEKRAGSFRDVDSSGTLSAGDLLDFTFAVTNMGTVTIDKVAVDDELLAGGGVEADCPVGSLAPGASMVCAASGYRVTAEQAAAGSLTNAAAATGALPDGLVEAAASAGGDRPRLIEGRDSVTLRVDRPEESGAFRRPGSLAATGSPWSAVLPPIGFAFTALGAYALHRRRQR